MVYFVQDNKWSVDEIDHLFLVNDKALYQREGKKYEYKKSHY